MTTLELTVRTLNVWLWVVGRDRGEELSVGPDGRPKRDTETFEIECDSEFGQISSGRRFHT